MKSLKSKYLIAALLAFAVSFIFMGCQQAITVTEIKNDDLDVNMRIGYPEDAVTALFTMSGEELPEGGVSEMMKQELESELGADMDFLDVSMAEWEEAGMKFIGYDMNYTMSSLIRAAATNADVDGEQVMEFAGGFNWQFDPEAKTVIWSMETPNADEFSDPEMQFVQYVTINLPGQRVLKTSGKETENGIEFSYKTGETQTLSAEWILTGDFMSENFGILSLMSLLNLSNTPSSALVDSALEWLVKLDLPEKFIEEFKESYKFSTATPSDIEDEESYPFTSLIQFADKDMISSQSHREALNALVSAGVMQGSGGYLNPLAPVTRAEAAVMLSRALRIVNYLSSPNESDVKILDVPEDHWAFEDIKFVYYHGVVNGTEVINDNTFVFSPNAPLTYEALGLMIENACDALGWNKVRSAEDKNLSMYSPWAVDGAYWVTDGKEPGSTASREDFALMVFEFLTYDY